MAASRYSFEIQIRRDGRWVSEFLRDREDDARKLAGRILDDRAIAGVRIIRNWNRPDGAMIETEIFSEVREVREEKPLHIARSVPVPARCADVEDYFGYACRQAMARIFRAYAEKMAVTPTEILHNHAEVKRLQDRDSLLASAIDWVASLQAEQDGQEIRTRRDELFRAVDQIASRARAVAKLGLPRINGGFGAAIALLPIVDEAGRDYLALAMLSRDLLDRRDWLGKLDRLCELGAAERDSAALRLIDGAMADVLACGAVHDVLGWQPTPGAAIRCLFDFADGTMATGRSACPALAASLNRLLADGKLAQSRRCLVDLAHRQLRQAASLHPRDPALEHEEFRMVVLRVLAPDGLHSGADTADALTARYGRMVEQGGKAGRRAAMAGVFHAMPDRASAVLYLCDLARGDYAAGHLDDMIALLDRVRMSATIDQLCHGALSAEQKMQRATAAHRAVMASAYPADIRQDIAGHIDSVLERFVTEEKVIDRLDLPDHPLRDRAIRLVRFCGSGLLPPGRALDRSRERVLALLRQPDFDARFVAGIDCPASAQQALREFFALLQRNIGTGQG